MATGAPPRFRLPADVTVIRETVPEGVAYVFRHQQLGLLGRLIATDSPGQQTLLSAEGAGDAADPMTAERRAILEPLVEPPEQDAEILKVYPVREPARRLSPEAFPALVDPLTEQHCDGLPVQTRSGPRARRPQRR